MARGWQRNAALFLGSQLISLFGSALVQYAIMWHITLTTQSGAMMAVSVICGFLPQFLMSPFAGVWADRHDRKRLIVLADSGIALATLALALVFMSGRGRLWMLFATLAIRAIGSAVHSPAVSAFLPQIVPSDQLMRVNALNGSIQSVVTLASPMLSAALLGAAGIQAAFFVDVFTAALAVAVLMAFLHVPAQARPAAAAQSGSYFADMRQGFHYIRSNDYVKTYILFSAAFFFLAAPVMSLTPLQVTRSFGGDVWHLSAIEVAFSVGMLAGGLILASWGGFRNKVHSMLFSVGIMSVGTIALGMTRTFWFYVVIMGLMGAAIPMFNTPATVLIQQRVDPAFLGRVFSAFGMLMSITVPLAMVVWGPLADVIKVEWMLVATGAATLVEGLIMFGNRPFVAAGEPAAAPEPE